MVPGDNRDQSVIRDLQVYEDIKENQDCREEWVQQDHLGLKAVPVKTLISSLVHLRILYIAICKWSHKDFELSVLVFCFNLIFLSALCPPTCFRPTI